MRPCPSALLLSAGLLARALAAPERAPPHQPDPVFLRVEVLFALARKADILTEQGKTEAANDEMKKAFAIEIPREDPAWEAKARAFLRDRKTIGAIVPTSSLVGRRMARLAGVHEARKVVEFGPGTGPITKPLLEALPADGRLWAYEIYEPFLERLRATFDDPRLTLIGQSAEMVRDLRAREVPEGFDAIVCSIPLANLPAHPPKSTVGCK
jgi:hypothetical protein